MPVLSFKKPFKIGLIQVIHNLWTYFSYQTPSYWVGGYKSVVFGLTVILTGFIVLPIQLVALVLRFYARFLRPGKVRLIPC